jgi:uncharacterized LabA/DUF88 family protein
MSQQYLFIDGGYLRSNYEKQMESFYGTVPGIDYQMIKSAYKAHRVYFYDAVDYTQHKDETEAAWKARVDAADERLDHINSLPGFHVRAGEVRKAARRDRREQKGVDVQLAVDSLEHAARGNMSLAMFLTGDLDFEPLLACLLRMGVPTRLLYCPLTTSKPLRRAADDTRKVTLAQFHQWAAPSFRGVQPAVGLGYNEVPDPGVYAKARGGTAGGRAASLWRATNGGPHKLYVAAGNEFNEPSVTFTFRDLDRLTLAYSLTFGDIEWHDEDA